MRCCRSGLTTKQSFPSEVGHRRGRVPAAGSGAGSSGHNGNRSTATLPRGRARGRGAVTLIELLCVVAILSILMSMLLPTVGRAYRRVRGQVEEWEAPETAHLLRTKAQDYCVAHPRYRFRDKQDFVRKCDFHPKCRDWLEARQTEFVPFDFTLPETNIVLTVHIGRKHATLYAFTKGELSVRPEAR